MPKPNQPRMPDNERQGLGGMRLALKVKASPKAKAKRARGAGRTHGQRCPHCAAHLRPLEPTVEREEAQCIACDGWFKRTHYTKPEPIVAEESHNVRDALALIEDMGPGDGCPVCGAGARVKYSGTDTDDETMIEGVVEAGSFDNMCLDPDKMHGAADGFGGSDYYGE